MKQVLFNLLLAVFISGGAANAATNTLHDKPLKTVPASTDETYVWDTGTSTLKKTTFAPFLVGDCTGFPCLDGTSDGGNYIKLWAGAGSYWTALQGGSPAANRSWRLPIAAPPAAGTTYLMNMDEYGQMGFAPAVSDTAYGVGWNGDTGAASKNAIYDKIETIAGGSMTYPGAGIPVSTGTAWGTSITLGAGASAALGYAPDAAGGFLLANTYLDDPLISWDTATITEVKNSPVAGTNTISVKAGVFQAYDSNMIIWPSAVSATEVGYLDGATSSIQTQLGTKAQAIATEVNGASSATLTAAQVSSTIVYNTGMGDADVALTLPTAAAGYTALFTVGTAQSFKWGVRAGASDKIYLLAADGTIAAGADNGYARMTAAQVGQSFACWTIKTDAYDWQCKAVSIGTSTFAAN